MSIRRNKIGSHDSQSRTETQNVSFLEVGSDSVYSTGLLTGTPCDWVAVCGDDASTGTCPHKSLHLLPIFIQRNDPVRYPFFAQNSDTGLTSCPSAFISCQIGSRHHGATAIKPGPNAVVCPRVPLDSGFMLIDSRLGTSSTYKGPMRPGTGKWHRRAAEPVERLPMACFRRSLSTHRRQTVCCAAYPPVEVVRIWPGS
jgi:hypothetical protein